MEIKKPVVIGGGIMGAGIGQLCEQKGLDVARTMQAEGLKSMLEKSEIKATSFNNLGNLSMTGSNQESIKREEIMKIERQIEKLDDKLIEGTLSEEKHAELLNRLKKKLKDLNNSK